MCAVKRSKLVLPDFRRSSKAPVDRKVASRLPIALGHQFSQEAAKPDVIVNVSTWVCVVIRHFFEKPNDQNARLLVRVAIDHLVRIIGVEGDALPCVQTDIPSESPVMRDLNTSMKTKNQFRSNMLVLVAAPTRMKD